MHKYGLRPALQCVGGILCSVGKWTQNIRSVFNEVDSHHSYSFTTSHELMKNELMEREYRKMLVGDHSLEPTEWDE